MRIRYLLKTNPKKQTTTGEVHRTSASPVLCFWSCFQGTFTPISQQAVTTVSMFSHVGDNIKYSILCAYIKGNVAHRRVEIEAQNWSLLQLVRRLKNEPRHVVKKDKRRGTADTHTQKCNARCKHYQTTLVNMTHHRLGARTPPCLAHQLPWHAQVGKDEREAGFFPGQGCSL